MGAWGETSIYAKNVYCTGSMSGYGAYDAKIMCHNEDTCNIYCIHRVSTGECGTVYCDGNCNVQCDGGPCPQILYENLCYTISGNPGMISGDPHITTWAGVKHDFMGQPQNGLDQFYYIYPCHGFDNSDLPFHLLATYKNVNDKITSLDYFVLELFVGDGEEYVVFLNPEIHSYAMVIDGADNTNYDDPNTPQQRNQLISGNAQLIGGRFEILYIQKDEKTIS